MLMLVAHNLRTLLRLQAWEGGEVLILWNYSTNPEEFIERSELFKATGGVHGAALCDADNLLIFSEDIGRHNAVDKIFGECILKDISMDNRIIITSGRVSSEILLKVARASIPLLISKSATTNLAVKLANELGVTLIGFVRGERMNVYTHRWRIRTDGK
jgi:FdhD protein